MATEVWIPAAYGAILAKKSPGSTIATCHRIATTNNFFLLCFAQDFSKASDFLFHTNNLIVTKSGL